MSHCCRFRTPFPTSVKQRVRCATVSYANRNCLLFHMWSLDCFDFFKKCKFSIVYSALTASLQHACEPSVVCAWHIRDSRCSHLATLHRSKFVFDRSKFCNNFFEKKKNNNKNNVLRTFLFLKCYHNTFSSHSRSTHLTRFVVKVLPVPRPPPLPRKPESPLGAFGSAAAQTATAGATTTTTTTPTTTTTTTTTTTPASTLNVPPATTHRGSFSQTSSPVDNFPVSQTSVFQFTNVFFFFFFFESSINIANVLCFLSWWHHVCVCFIFI